MKLRIAELLAAAAGTAVCMYISPPAGAVMLVSAAVMLLIQHAVHKQREKRIHTLCSEIDGILLGMEQINLDAYDEGAVGTLSSELNKVFVRLREQNEAIQKEQAFMKEAMEDMSHQLRTPLTSAILLTGRLRRPGLDRQEYLKSTQELTKLLSGMQWQIETILGVSRLDAGAVTMHPQEILCRELVSKALDPISVTLELRGITVSVDCPADAVLVCDESYTVEALLNILKNCMEHTPEGGSITVQVYENSIYTQILISDSGEGFSEEALPHLFERFYRSAPDSTSGYGIGLNFALKIIRKQEGTLTARNAPEGGAQFEIRFYRTIV